MIYKYTGKDRGKLLLRNARHFNLGTNSQKELDVLKDHLEKLIFEVYLTHPISDSNKFDNLPLRGEMQRMKINNPLLSLLKHFWADNFNGEPFRESGNHSYYYEFYICSFAKSITKYLNENYKSPEKGNGIRLVIDDSTFGIPKNNMDGIYLSPKESKKYWASYRKGDNTTPPSGGISVFFLDVDYDETHNYEILKTEINALFSELLYADISSYSKNNVVHYLMSLVNPNFCKWLMRAITLKPKVPFEKEDEVRLIIMTHGNGNKIGDEFVLSSDGLFFEYGNSPTDNDNCFYLHYRNNPDFIIEIQK